jgi:hypothetical protein
MSFPHSADQPAGWSAEANNRNETETISRIWNSAEFFQARPGQLPILLVSSCMWPFVKNPEWS